MIPENGIYTRNTAQNVANGVAYLVEHPGDDYLVLKLTRQSRASGTTPAITEEFDLAVRLIEDSPSILSLANGGELVRCLTKEGRRLDILFGKPLERSVEPAWVLIEE